MTTLCELPLDIFYSNILPHLFYDGRKYCDVKILLNYARINILWNKLIFSKEFINIILKMIHTKRPPEFENMVEPIERMKLIYKHKYSVYIKTPSLVDGIYNGIITHHIDIEGNINTITMFNGHKIIADNLLDIYKNIYIKKVNISICFNSLYNRSMFRFTINIIDNTGVIIEDILFSTNRPEFYTFKMYGFCKIKTYIAETALE